MCHDYHTGMEWISTFDVLDWSELVKVNSNFIRKVQFCYASKVYCIAVVYYKCLLHLRVETNLSCY